MAGNIGKRISEQRARRGMTLDELGRAAGVNRQTVFKYERGIIVNIPVDKLEKMAVALGVTTSYLIGLEYEETYPNISDELKQYIENEIDNSKADVYKYILEAIEDALQSVRKN
jgi:transcriptional regulator with XRE-family HTH domain